MSHVTRHRSLSLPIHFTSHVTCFRSSAWRADFSQFVRCLMTSQGRWFDRKFELGLGPDAAPELLKRLRRTPERLADAVRGLPPEVLTRKHEGKWSIQENAGHLSDLEPLWEQRLDDYDAGA